MHPLLTLRQVLEREKIVRADANVAVFETIGFNHRAVMQWYGEVLLGESQNVPDGPDFCFRIESRVKALISACLYDRNIPVNRITAEIQAAFFLPVIHKSTRQVLEKKYLTAHSQDVTILELEQDWEKMRIYLLLYHPDISLSDYLKKWSVEVLEKKYVKEPDSSLELIQRIFRLLHKKYNEPDWMTELFASL